jgi:hypothetical protein
MEEEVESERVVREGRRGRGDYDILYIYESVALWLEGG